MTNSKLLFSLLLAGSVGTVSAQSLNDAKSAIESENYGKAKSILQQLVEKQAKNGANYFYLGQIYLVNEKPDSAAIYFNQGLTVDPKSSLNQVGLGTIDLLNNNASAAESKFAAVAAGVNKKSYVEFYEIGRAYLNAPKPDYAKALEYLTQAKTRTTKDALVPLALGDAYTGMNESSLAYTNYRDAVDLDASLVRAQVRQAVIIRRAQAFDEAVAQLTTITEENPNYAPTFRELAETYNAWALQPSTTEEQYKELNKKAVDSYKKYLAVTGDSSFEARLRYADFLVFAREYGELKTVSEELIKNVNVDAKIYRYLGYIAYQDKDYAKSAEYLTNLLEKINPTRVISRDYMFAGLANASLKNEAKAIELLKKAIELDPELDETIAETGFINYGDQDYPGAVTIFKAVSAFPKSDYINEATYYLGEASYLLGYNKTQAEQDASAEYKQAYESLSTILASTDKEVIEKFQKKALYYRAWSQLAQDNLEAPKGDYVPDFQKFIDTVDAEGKVEDFKSMYGDANNYVGFFYYTKGNNAKAKAYFQKVLSLNPTDEFALQMIDYVK